MRSLAETGQEQAVSTRAGGVRRAPAPRLAAAGVPFVFATGYGASGIHEDWSGRPVLQKPFQSDSLNSALASALGARSAADISH